MATESPDKIQEKVTEIEVVSISEPAEASNGRGNPEVEVIVSVMGSTAERYRFEFVRPPEDAKFPHYRNGPSRMSEEATPSKYYNEALFEAAEALSEHTDTSVKLILNPTSEWEDREEQLSV